MTNRLFTLTLALVAASALRAATVDPAIQQLSRAILKELIEINTTDTPRGNVTAAAIAMQKRFTAAGVPAADMFLAGPNDRKKNLVIRLHGTSPAQKPILILCHLDVVEAKR